MEMGDPRYSLEGRRRIEQKWSSKERESVGENSGLSCLA